MTNKNLLPMLIVIEPVHGSQKKKIPSTEFVTSTSVI